MRLIGSIEELSLISLFVIYPFLHFSLIHLGDFRNEDFIVPHYLLVIHFVVMGSLLLLIFNSKTNKNLFPLLKFAGIQLFMTIAILLNFLNNSGETFQIMFWTSIVLFCNFFESRRYLFFFLLTNFFLTGITVLASPVAPSPDFMFFLWYPIVGLVVFLFVGIKIQDREELHSRKGMLKESEEMFKLIFEEANYGIVITNREKQIIRVNKAMCAIFKYSEEELLTMGSHDLTYPEDQNVTFQLFDKASVKGKDQYTTEKRYICKDGEVINCNVSVRIIRDLENRHVLNIGLIENITERKKDEAKIKEYARKLQQSNKDLEEFAYVVSHDLREPLRMISSYLQLIEKKFSEQLGLEGGEYISFATDGAKRMNRLILDLLSYSRVGRQNVKKWIDTERVMELAIRNLRLKIFENEAIIKYGNMPTILGNEIQLVLLFQNLIQNALKYRKPDEKPVIKISAAQKGDFWEFVIEDNGIGIEKAVIDHIFIIFYQANPDDPGTSGSGIGLAICQKIVKLHQGNIRVESELGEWTRFFINLPYHPFVKDTPVEVLEEEASA